MGSESIAHEAEDLLGEGKQLVPSFWYPAEEFLKNCFLQTLKSVCNKVKKISS